MAVKSMAYDDVAYQAVHGATLGTVGAGANANSQRFVAFSNLLLKAVNYSTVTIGTGAATDVKTLFVLRQGTATTTQVLSTTTAASYVLNIVSTLTATKGDVLWVNKGTDATEVGAASVEYTIVPGADVTA